MLTFTVTAQVDLAVAAMTPKEKSKERIIIYKNVLIVSLSFLLLFVAFESMSKLQSSINTVQSRNQAFLQTLREYVANIENL